jgi:hypothetical protein
MQFLKKETPEGRFWNWFALHSRRIFRFENNQERVFDELTEQLDQIHPSLTFEFGPVEEARREFIISADGDKEAFPAVQRLAAAAPPLREWIVTPFRPPKDLEHYSSIVIDDVRLSVDDIWFSFEQDGALIHLDLYITDWSEERDEQLGLAAFLLLDVALGEYVVETRVGSISRHRYEADVDPSLHPFRQIVSAVVLPEA